MRARYQLGSVRREARKHGPDVWVFRWRESATDGKTVRRKTVIGNVTELRTKAAALQACETLRSTVNRETRTPKMFGELATHYTEKELPSKTPYTREVYSGYLKTWILPMWKDCNLSDIRTVAVEEWLKVVPLSNGTKAKLRNLMHSIYNHAVRWEFAGHNPITLVRQSAKRTRTPEVLTVVELNSLLKELPEPWKTAVFVAATTGLRVSELLALKWEDVDFIAEEIRLCRGVVRQHLGVMKTEASRKPVPLDSVIAGVLLRWRSSCPFNQDTDYIFGSLAKDGKQPYWPNAAMEDHIRPAALRAGFSKRIGWHTLRHTFGTLIKNSGADVATTQALMRHANVSVTMDRYVQAISEAKRSAQHALVGVLDPCGPAGFQAECKLLN